MLRGFTTTGPNGGWRISSRYQEQHQVFQVAAILRQANWQRKWAGTFRDGLVRVLEVWINSVHFSKSDLSAELYTVVDESRDPLLKPSVVHHRVKEELVEPLQHEFGITFKLSFKRNNDSICHARYLQIQSIAILFERGFDFVVADGTLRRTTMNIDCDYTFRKIVDSQSIGPEADHCGFFALDGKTSSRG